MALREVQCRIAALTGLHISQLPNHIPGWHHPDISSSGCPQLLVLCSAPFTKPVCAWAGCDLADQDAPWVEMEMRTVTSIWLIGKKFLLFSILLVWVQSDHETNWTSNLLTADCRPFHFSHLLVRFLQSRSKPPCWCKSSMSFYFYSCKQSAAPPQAQTFVFNYLEFHHKKQILPGSFRLQLWKGQNKCLRSQSVISDQLSKFTTFFSVMWCWHQACSSLYSASNRTISVPGSENNSWSYLAPCRTSLRRNIDINQIVHLRKKLMF